MIGVYASIMPIEEIIAFRNKLEKEVNRDDFGENPFKSKKKYKTKPKKIEKVFGEGLNIKQIKRK